MSNLRSTTTIGGVLPAVLILINQLSSLMDSDPQTVVNLDSLCSAVGLLVVGLCSVSIQFFGKKKG